MQVSMFDWLRDHNSREPYGAERVATEHVVTRLMMREVANETAVARPTNYRFSIEQIEWAVRSVDFGFILQNVELCHLKRMVPKNILQAFEWHACQVQVCC
jgi:hypothetical protein